MAVFRHWRRYPAADVEGWVTELRKRCHDLSESCGVLSGDIATLRQELKKMVTADQIEEEVSRRLHMRSQLQLSFAQKLIVAVVGLSSIASGLRGLLG